MAQDRPLANLEPEHFTTRWARGLASLGRQASSPRSRLSGRRKLRLLVFGTHCQHLHLEQEKAFPSSLFSFTPGESVRTLLGLGHRVGVGMCGGVRCRLMNLRHGWTLIKEYIHDFILFTHSFFLRDKVSRDPGWPCTCYVPKDDLLPLPLEQDYSCGHHGPFTQCWELCPELSTC